MLRNNVLAAFIELIKTSIRVKSLLILIVVNILLKTLSIIIITTYKYAIIEFY